MKLEINFGRLERARESISAEKAVIEKIRPPRRRSGNPIEIKLLEEGAIILNDIDLENVHFPAGLAAIGNTQGLLHIYQPWNSLEELSEEPAPAPKFHAMHCQTLEHMMRANRYNRYVFTARSETGLFRVEPWDNETKTRLEEIMAKLAPCKNCLKELNYDSYETLSSVKRNEMVNNFDLESFLENYKPIFRCLPLYTPETFPEGNYTKNWARKSEEIRVQAGWACSCCKVVLDKNRGLLHVHHKDGNRGNERPSNLRVLCVLCHKKQPLHGGMYVKRTEERKFTAIRKKQGLPVLCINCGS